MLNVLELSSCCPCHAATRLPRHVARGRAVRGPWQALIRGRRALTRLRAAPDPQSPGSYEGGDPNLQDALVNQIKFEIGKKQVDSFVEEKSEGLRQVAEEGKAELEKLAELAELKSEVAFNSAMADVNREVDEFEEELRKSREKLQAQEAEFGAWERDMAVARSQGQFFQSLYQEDKKRPVGASAEQIKAQAQRVQEPARRELGSTVRQYTFSISAAVLAASAVLDYTGDSPSPLQDTLYLALAVVLVWSSYNERKAL